MEKQLHSHVEMLYILAIDMRFIKFYVRTPMPIQIHPVRQMLKIPYKSLMKKYHMKCANACAGPNAEDISIVKKC